MYKDKEKEILDDIEFLLQKYRKRINDEEITMEIPVNKDPIKSFRGKSKNKDIVKILLEERRKERNK